MVVSAVCHCEHCRRQGGGAFSVNVVVHTTQLNVSGTLQTDDETDEAGTLDDRSTLQPDVEPRASTASLG